MILHALSGGLAANRVTESRGEGLLAHAFTPGFRAALHHKDLGIALATDREQKVPLPGTALIVQLFAMWESRGQGQLDHSGLLIVLEELASHRIGETTAG